ncbi:unnamed protein product, partial [Polarella glacialis]
MDWLAKTFRGRNQNTTGIQHRGLDGLASTIAAGSSAVEEVTLQQFTDGELKHWGHRERLLLSWLLIQRHGRREAIRLLFQGARRILQGNFHETTLYFWMHMVHYAIQATANPLGDFKGFVLMSPQLVKSDLFLDYYTQDTIWHNPDARDEVVMPDKKPLPSLLSQEVQEQPRAF